jgi:2-dehydropantoate 2-reductase
MRIAVIGAGGVGGGFGAALAKTGQAEVTFVARGAHLAAMRDHGLKVEGDRGETLIDPVRATDDPAAIGPVDIVLFCVKLWDVESAGAAARPLIGPDTGVIPLQNGIDASERLDPILGADHVMAGTVGISAIILRPGVIGQTGTFMTMAFGERDGRRSARAEAFLAVAKPAGFQVALSDRVAVPIWEKFILLTAMSGGTAITRLPVGKLRDDPDVFGLFESVMEETAAVGRAEGVPIPEGEVAKRAAVIRALPPNTMASMAVDLARGNRLELPWLAGKVVALGRKHGIATPANAAIFAALKPYENGAPA